MGPLHSQSKQNCWTRRASPIWKMFGKGVWSRQTFCPARVSQGECPANRCPANIWYSLDILWWNVRQESKISSEGLKVRLYAGMGYGMCRNGECLFFTTTLLCYWANLLFDPINYSWILSLCTWRFMNEGPARILICVYELHSRLRLDPGIAWHCNCACLLQYQQAAIIC